MTLAFAAPPQVSVPIRGTDKRFPVRRIYNVGRNYNEHVAEMGGVVGRDPPFFFMKPADAIVTDGRFPYPPMSADVHHEIELVVALGPDAEIFGCAVGLDMTRRDLQAAAKKLGRPWETSKAFDYSGPMSEIVPMTKPLTKGAITLSVNGAVKQKGDIADMIWGLSEIMVELSKLFELKAGDLIFTGTPAGVGPVIRGDRLEGEIEGLGKLVVKVV
ncbi:MAG: fumarylacetoacetate hydrolase family protein [Rhizobiales bacterium]|nr:fumarylacetoacetate hydrolase family protein [Hyphomicrobiales bacterium]